jgi:hypothetical protein
LHFFAPFALLYRILCWFFTLINRFGTIIAIYFSVFRKHQLLSAHCNGLRTIKKRQCALFLRRGKNLPLIGAARLAKKKLVCFIVLTIRYVNPELRAIVCGDNQKSSRKYTQHHKYA